MDSIRTSKAGTHNISTVADCSHSEFMSMNASSEDLSIFAAGLGIGLTAGFVGLLFRRPKMKRDALLLAVLTVYFCRLKVLGLLPHLPFTPSEVSILLIPLLVFNCIQTLFLYKIKDTRTGPTFGDQSPSALKPFIFPASTSHTRFFPRHHTFRYSYFLVGVPVGWRGRINNLLACDDPRSTSWWNDPWLSVHAEDYLFYTRLSPGSQAPSLREKLDAYLRSEEVDPAVYPYAYLVTAPRVLGLNFNPVSFWYLYDAGVAFKAIILEVNNTFGERRMYLLREAVSADDSLHRHATTKKEIWSAETPLLDERTPKSFVSKWNKDFHVSPFNDREGIYSLTAVDPFVNGLEGTSINNIITLSSPPYHTVRPEPVPTQLSGPSPDVVASPPPKTKLVASIASTSTINPITLNLKPAKQYKFLLKHIRIGFLTNPRILREAWTLWMKGLKVWYRPEVTVATVGREETEEETAIEKVFELWLRRVASRSKRTLNYFPAAGEKRGLRVVLRNGVNDKAEETAVSAQDVSPGQEPKIGGDVAQDQAKIRAQDKGLEIKILTPAFYGELVRTTHFREGWEQRCFNAKAGEAMVWTSDKQALESLIDSEINMSNTGHDCTRVGGDETDILKQDEKRFKIAFRIGTAFVGTFRYRNRGKGSHDNTALSFADIVSSHTSSCTSSPSTTKQLADFCRASVHIHLADSYAWGSTGLLRFYGSMIHFALVWLAAKQLSFVIMDAPPFGCGMACNLIAMGEWCLLVLWLSMVGIRPFVRIEYTYS